MGEFFKPWRRKLGVVTLLMACVFAAGWSRSFRNHEIIKVQVAQGLGIVDSHRGNFVCCRLSILNMPRYLGPPYDVIAMNSQIGDSKELSTTYRSVYGNRIPFEWNAIPLDSIGLGDSVFEDPELHRLGICGMTYAWKSIVHSRSDTSNSEEERFTFIVVPYWSIVLPLTSLSAWLLLSKPRPTKRAESPITTAN